MKINPKTIAFDFDDVIVDLFQCVCRLMKEKHDVDLNMSVFTQFDIRGCCPEHADNIWRCIDEIVAGRHSRLLLPVPGAPQCLRAIARVTGKPIEIVTARPSAESATTWLRLHGIEPGAFKVTAVGTGNSKIEVLKSIGVTHFVDDRFKTCEEVAAAGMTPVLFKTVWNLGRIHSFTEVADWLALRNLLDMEVWKCDYTT